MVDVPGSLRALVSKVIDYAGLYPPAALALPEVIENYERYLASAESWMLNRLVLPASGLAEVRMGAEWRVTLLVDAEPGALPAQVETLETRLAHGFSLPTYCEAPIETIQGGFAKIRTGGLTAEAVPSPESLADFLCTAAARKLAFKATAGLHHPIRSAAMHGFVNVFVAAAFAWGSADRTIVLEILNEEDASAFAFGEDDLRWRGRAISTETIRTARRDFAHSFGSCSFEEPVADLRTLFLRRQECRRLEFVHFLQAEP